MPEVVRRRGGLHDDRVGAAELADDPAAVVGARGEVGRDRAGDSGDLDGVRQAVVHRETGAGL